MIIVTRIVTALLLILVAVQIGQSSEVIRLLPSDVDRTLRIGSLGMLGALTGWVLGGLLGKLLQRGLERLRATLGKRSGAELLVASAGLMLGLVVSWLLSLPLRRLEFVGVYLLLPMTLIVSYVFAEIAALKHMEILRLFGVQLAREGAVGKLVDTSVLIDGRIVDLLRSGFLEGELVVPVFVLEELQRIADSSDDLRRARGRRGLDVVQKLRKSGQVTTPADDWGDIPAVDSKLVRMASEQGLAIVTTDFNLNKVAQIQQVKVLNVNELANALKPEFVTGEQFQLKVVREGKEPGQGVGYLDDGTMVVVDRGRQTIGQRATVEVTSVIQSASGKLVFSRLVDGAAEAASPAASPSASASAAPTAGGRGESPK